MTATTKSAHDIVREQATEIARLKAELEERERQSRNRLTAGDELSHEVHQYLRTVDPKRKLRYLWNLIDAWQEARISHAPDPVQIRAEKAEELARKTGEHNVRLLKERDAARGALNMAWHLLEDKYGGAASIILATEVIRDWRRRAGLTTESQSSPDQGGVEP